MRWFNKYFDYLLLAALAVAGVTVMSRFLHWEIGNATLAVYAASLFAGLALGRQLLKLSSRRRGSRRR
ncbi:MAG: hypothetical protein ACYDGX_06150 [Thermoleophilia bacterium]